MTPYVEQREPRYLPGRLYYVAGIVLFIFLLIIIRLWHLQVIKSSEMKRFSENNRIRVVRLTAPRGIIFDRNGNRLVENRPGFDLTVVREDLKDIEALKETLPDRIEIAPDAIEEALRRGRRLPPYQSIKLKEDIGWEEVAAIESFRTDIPGIGLDVSPRRLYPYNGLASHLIGYVGEIDEGNLRRLGGVDYKAGDTIGKYGLEESWDGFIRGSAGGKQIEVDAIGREIALLEKLSPVPGNNIYLTIDLNTQKRARQLMKGKAGAIVAMEPRSGRILAMVSSPSFDPNVFTTRMTDEEWERLVKNPLNILTNRVIQGQYPPASTFKVITAAALLEDGLISSSAKIESGPVFEFGGREYRDWKEEGHGAIDVYRAIVESSDTFFYQMGLKLGVDRLSHYAIGFGLGTRTGIEIKGEKGGLVPSKAWKKGKYGKPWYMGETISVSVGQGFLLATPLQVLSAYAAIANGGRLFLPQVVERIETPDGEVIRDFVPKETGVLPVSKRTLDVVRSALKGVVSDDKGTARFIRTRGLAIAGKTGTAQVAMLGEERLKAKEIPYRLRDHAWFAGYAPADDPKIAVAVLVEHGGFGSEIAAPIAREVMRTYLMEKKRVVPVAFR
ncbi:MAG: penicillin-binding protein 2 [Deltaproteobacteria bacterium]|nr:penicillin-binding protein 2 [Deltaproteobacteria bacterium]